MQSLGKFTNKIHLSNTSHIQDFKNHVFFHMSYSNNWSSNDYYNVMQKSTLKMSTYWQ